MILTGNLGEYQRITNDGIVRIETLHNGEPITYYCHCIGILIALVGNVSGGKSRVLYATITTLLKSHAW